MRSIKSLIPSQATVIRAGVEHTIPAEDVVIGDVVLLSYGNKVPADVRIIESHDLKFDKSLLTGESESVDGCVECTDENYLESKNIAFMTTLITNGQGKGVVICTGQSTMIGKIASLTNHTNQKESSLQTEIRRFVIFISMLAITTVVILLIFWGAYIRKHYASYIDVPTMMVNCIAVMVAFIPTGLPVAVTLSLLLIARKMAKCRVLVKNLSVIETLSCVNVIASDKTGTLTQNKMFVSNIAAGRENFVEVKEDEVPAETAKARKTGLSLGSTVAFRDLVVMTKLCNNSHFVEDEENMRRPINQRAATGDATDTALLKFATQHLEPSDLENYVETMTIPFNSRNKWMMKTFQLLNEDSTYMILKVNLAIFIINFKRDYLMYL
jgi:sodium/potassium-transporting ATPase subunit alpha